jgi:adenylate cyclase
VEGSVRKAGKRIRITAQLIEASTGNHVWAERYDRDLEDLFAVQDDVTERIVWALIGKVGAAEISRSKQTRKRLDSYDALLRGIEGIHRFTGVGAASAIEYFNLAIGLEPNSALAHSWLAEAYAVLSVFNTDQSMKVLALQAAQRAIELGDTGGHPEAIIATYYAWKGDFETAEANLQRALMLGPTNSDVLSWAGYI